MEVSNTDGMGVSEDAAAPADCPTAVSGMFFEASVMGVSNTDEIGVSEDAAAPADCPTAVSVDVMFPSTVWGVGSVTEVSIPAVWVVGVCIAGGSETGSPTS